jgi:hypothetical protein
MPRHRSRVDGHYAPTLRRVARSFRPAASGHCAASAKCLARAGSRYWELMRSSASIGAVPAFIRDQAKPPESIIHRVILVLRVCIQSTIVQVGYVSESLDHSRGDGVVRRVDPKTVDPFQHEMDIRKRIACAQDLQMRNVFGRRHAGRQRALLIETEHEDRFESAQAASRKTLIEQRNRSAVRLGDDLELVEIAE